MGLGRNLYDVDTNRVSHLTVILERIHYMKGRIFRLQKGLNVIPLIDQRDKWEKKRASLHGKPRERGGNENEVTEVTVSCYGSWKLVEMRVASLHGFVAVLQQTTGLCIDFVVLSKRWNTCEHVRDSKNVHLHECTKQFYPGDGRI